VDDVDDDGSVGGGGIEEWEDEEGIIRQVLLITPLRGASCRRAASVLTCARERCALQRMGCSLPPLWFRRSRVGWKAEAVLPLLTEEARGVKRRVR
jgi:hypothetical protein